MLLDVGVEIFKPARHFTFQHEFLLAQVYAEIKDSLLSFEGAWIELIAQLSRADLTRVPDRDAGAIKTFDAPVHGHSQRSLLTASKLRLQNVFGHL